MALPPTHSCRWPQDVGGRECRLTCWRESHAVSSRLRSRSRSRSPDRDWWWWRRSRKWRCRKGASRNAHEHKIRSLLVRLIWHEINVPKNCFLGGWFRLHILRLVFLACWQLDYLKYTHPLKLVLRRSLGWPYIHHIKLYLQINVPVFLNLLQTSLQVLALCLNIFIICIYTSKDI